MPWICLFLLKMAMQECGAGYRDMVKDDFDKLANRIFRIQHLASPIGEGDIDLMVRPMVLQQAWYQWSSFHDVKAITRQMIWYTDTETPFSIKFSDLYGFPLKEFYLISLYLNVCVADQAKGVVGVNLYELIFCLSPTISLRNIAKYFLLVTVRSQDLPGFFQAHKIEADLHQQSEFVQITPLRKKPILLDGDNLLIYNSKLFSRSVGTLVPDLLKSDKNWRYKDFFGPTMERYLASLLQASPMKFYTEKQLDQFCRDNSVIKGKMADFLVAGKVNVIIECKAIEPGDIVSSTFKPELLKINLPKSFMIGIEQCQESIYRLSMTKEYAGTKFACIIVTHEDFWFASAEDIVKNIDQALEDKVRLKYGFVPIPFDRILFVTIDALENILQAASESEIDFDRFIVDCAQALKTPQGKRFTMSHVVQDKLVGKVSGTPMINKKADEWVSFFMTELDANKAAWQGLSSELIRQRMLVIDALHRKFDD